jgi:hypothetical protein
MKHAQAFQNPNKATIYAKAATTARPYQSRSFEIKATGALGIIELTTARGGGGD